MEIKMVEKNCDGCGTLFKVMDGSMQTFHSNYCATKGAIWKRDQLKALKNGASPTSSKNENSGKTQPLEQKKQNTESVEKKSMQLSPEPDIMPTQLPQIKSEQKEDEKMQSEHSNISGNITEKTVTSSGQKSEVAVLSETLPTELTAQLLTSVQDEYHLTSLIDSSAKELHSQMKGMFKNYPEPELGIRTYEPEKVQTACLCAKQITELLRLKLDIVKAHQGLK